MTYWQFMRKVKVATLKSHVVHTTERRNQKNAKSNLCKNEFKEKSELAKAQLYMESHTVMLPWEVSFSFSSITE